MRIVRLANFVGPQSGGLRTALRELGVGYREAGHDPVLIIPGEHFSDEETPAGPRDHRRGTGRPGPGR